jgi:crossover junction endodeoxyribonuclease RusA
MVNLVLKGQAISTNNCYYHAGKGVAFITQKAKALKNSYASQLKEQYTGKPLSGELTIHIKLFFGDKRKRDWDNYHKLSQDSMNKIVFEDDNQISKATVERFYDKDNPRIEIAIYETETTESARN